MEIDRGFSINWLAGILICDMDHDEELFWELLWLKATVRLRISMEWKRSIEISERVILRESLSILLAIDSRWENARQFRS
jgi:hypothetical protein